MNSTHNVSHLIDQAFGFMERTPNKSGGDASPMKCAMEGVAPRAEEVCFFFFAVPFDLQNRKRFAVPYEFGIFCTNTTIFHGYLLTKSRSYPL